MADTPAPGGFGPSPPFGRPHSGVVLVPAKTRPHPGVFSGPVTGAGVLGWAAILILIVLVICAVVAVVRRR